MRLKSIGGYVSLAIFTIQTNSTTFAVTTLSATAAFSSAVLAQQTPQNSDTKLLDQLKDKYNLDDPYRNHQNSGGVYQTIGQPVSNSRNLESEIKSAASTKAINLPPPQEDTSNPENTLQKYESQSLSIGLSHGTPTGDESGNVNLKYAKSGTRKIERNSSGKLIISNTNEPVEYVDGANPEDYLSNEINRNDSNFNADHAYGNNDMLHNEGALTHGSLSTGNSGTARAYQSVTQSADKALNTSINANAGWLEPSRNAFEDVQDNDGNFFTSCTSTTETNQQTMQYPGHDEHTCQKSSANNLDFCEVERNVRVPIVVGGSGFTSCGLGCYEISIGETGNNYLGQNGCAVYEESKSITLNLTDGIELEKVVVDGYVDDHIEFEIDNKLAFSLVDGAVSYTRELPNINYGNCENGGNVDKGRWYYEGDKTFGFKRHFIEGVNKPYKFGWNVLVGGDGEYLGKVQFYFKDTTGQGFGETETQFPEGCKDKVKANILNGGGLDKMHSQGLTDEQIGYSFCRFDEYKPLEVGTRNYPAEIISKLGAMYPGDTGNKTWKYSLGGYRCDPLGGQDYCIASAETGLQECFDWDDLLDIENQCEVYENDDSCSEVSRECTDGWDTISEGQTVCYNETVTFQCETGATYTQEISTTSNSCAGSLPCIGGDCTIGETERNSRFVEAAVMANVIQQADGDRSCTDELDPSTCRIFEGEAEYCSWEVTGLGMDCCEAPGGIDILSYVLTADLMLETNRMAADGLFGEAAEQGANALIDFADGAYTQFSDTAASGWQTISEPLTSAYNSVMGNVTGQVVDEAGQVVAEATAGASEGIISSTLSTLQQEAYKLVYDMLPEELAKGLFTEVAANEAGNQAGELVLNEALSSVLSGVMAAYAIYSYIKLALTLLTMCDENEADMGIKIGQRQCFKVEGSYCSSKFLGICYQKRQDYCCYNSILARIIMEQAGTQLSKDMTSCEGLTQQELSTLDFNKIDLSEWVGLMMDAGTVTTEATERNLTGGGSLVESRCEEYEVEDPETGVVTIEKNCFQKLEGGRGINTYGREVASERNKFRMEGGKEYSENAMKGAKDTANNLDCSVTPRPPICNFGFEVGGNN